MTTASGGGHSVAARHVHKSFGGVAALKGVDLEIGEGQSIGLIGENGAGKSTLINVLTGSLAPDRGSVQIDGEDVSLRTPQDALARGIGTVHQQNWLVPELTVLQNLELGREVTRTPLHILVSKPSATSLEALELVGLSQRINDPVRELSLPERQLIAISRACSRGTRLIVFDEPTAALTPKEATRLFSVINSLRQSGRSILYVSHRLEELQNVVDEIVVMRAGEVVAREPRTAGEGRLVELMAGRETLGQEQETVAYRRAHTSGQRHAKPIFTATSLTDAKGAFGDISFDLHAGEVLAVVGLPDSGSAELVQAVAGARRLSVGRIELDDKQVILRTPRSALQARIGYLPGDRKRNGVIPNMNVRDTITLSSMSRVGAAGFVSSRKQRQLAQEVASQCGVRSAGLDLSITALSGGNQQKALFGRMLAGKPRVIVAEDPTAGVDPGGREALYELLSAACQAGSAILLYSTDLREVAGISDRALVLWRGAAITQLTRDQLTVESLMAAQFRQTSGSQTAAA